MGLELNPLTGSYYLADDPRVQEVPADSVPPDTLEMAGLALRAVSEDLGLKGVTIRWFAPERPESVRMRQRYGSVPWVTFEAADLKGITFGKAHTEIWLSANLDGVDAIEVTTHEARHVKQYAAFLAGEPTALDPEDDDLAERDAGAYATTFLDAAEKLAEEAEAAERRAA